MPQSSWFDLIAAIRGIKCTSIYFIGENIHPMSTFTIWICFLSRKWLGICADHFQNLEIMQTGLNHRTTIQKWPMTGLLIAIITLVSWTIPAPTITVDEKYYARLFEKQLGEMLYVEQNMAIKLEELQQVVRRKELKEALVQHQKETMVQADRIRMIYEMLGVEPTPGTSAGYDGIVRIMI